MNIINCDYVLIINGSTDGHSLGIRCSKLNYAQKPKRILGGGGMLYKIVKYLICNYSY